MQNIMFKFYLFVLFGFLGGCQSPVPAAPNVGAKVLDFYELPAVYQDHRDQQQFVTIDGRKIAFTDHGNGQPIVLLHGVPTSSWMYRKLIPELQQDMRVITIDLLGYGSSDKPENDGVVYQDGQQAKRVFALLDHLDVEAYALLVHDMGGLIVWEMLHAQPDRVTDLVVLNTIVSKKGFNYPNVKSGMVSQQLMKAYSHKMTSSAMLAQTFRAMGLNDEHELSEEECYGYVAPLQEGGDAALYSFFTGVDDDLFKRLEGNETLGEHFNGKTLVLWGSKDKVLTAEQVPILKECLQIPDENIHIYHDNAHFLPEEIPQEIGRKVRAFVNNAKVNSASALKGHTQTH